MLLVSGPVRSRGISHPAFTETLMVSVFRAPGARAGAGQNLQCMSPPARTAGIATLGDSFVAVRCPDRTTGPRRREGLTVSKLALQSSQRQGLRSLAATPRTGPRTQSMDDGGLAGPGGHGGAGQMEGSRPKADQPLVGGHLLAAI